MRSSSCSSSYSRSSSASFVPFTALMSSSSLICSATRKLIEWISTRLPFFNRWVEGFPAVIIKNGKRDEAVLRRQNIPDAALDRALHGHGMEDEGEVLVGRLEPNGKITLVRRQN